MVAGIVSESAGGKPTISHTGSPFASFSKFLHSLISVSSEPAERSSLQTHSFRQQNSPSFWISVQANPDSQLVSLAWTFLPRPPSSQSSFVEQVREHIERSST